LRIIYFIILTLVAIVSGCTDVLPGLDNFRIWAVPDAVAVFPYSAESAENEVFSRARQAINLEAAVNEVVSFQLVLSSRNSPVVVWDVGVSDFRQGDRSIPAEQVNLYREAWLTIEDYPAWYLRISPYLRKTREFADPLVPLTAPSGALPIEVFPEHCEAVWCEIHVPFGAEPGLYRSELHVETKAGLARKFELILNVLPFSLPRERHLAMITGIGAYDLIGKHLEVGGEPYQPTRLNFDDPAYERAVNILDQTLKLIHEHRCSPLLHDIYPVRRIGKSGRLELDWSDYDRLVTGVLDGTAFEDREGSVAWPMPINDQNPNPNAYGGWDSSEYEKVLIDYLRQCVTHFEEQNWLNRHYIWIPVPGGNRGEQYQQFEKLGRVVRSADERLNLLCDLAPQSMQSYGYRNDPFIDLTSLIGTWCPPASMADHEALMRQHEAGRRIWLRPDRPPFAGSLSVIAPPDHAVCNPWHVYRFGYDGIFMPAINDWPEDGMVKHSNSDRILIWPGKIFGLENPIPSIRLKRLLRGAQDYEYLWLLERNRRPGIAKLIASDLVPFGGTDCYGEHFLDARPGGWVTDAGAWMLARKIMAMELIEAIKQRGDTNDESVPTESEQFVQQVEWARLIRAVRRLHVEVEGVRVRFNERNAAKPLQVETSVTVFNATRNTFSGDLGLGDLQEGWSQEPGKPIAKLESARATRRTIRADASTIQANYEGLLPIQVVLAGGDGQTVKASGRLCVLTSQRLLRPPVIDGKLDDWPLGATNVAGDFVLVGALDVPKENRDNPDHASNLTTAFVCHDDDYLYIAFNCEDDQMGERQISRHNYVRYEDLWPMGEDLVEVVIDPTNAAIDAGDLLHLIVKANGAVISEKGVECLSRVADHEHWPSKVIAAIDDQSDPMRWTVEIRIPLKSFGEQAPIWGINFARLNARLGEYASWSGARRHLYSPVTLGNMRLEP